MIVRGNSVKTRKEKVDLSGGGVRVGADADTGADADAGVSADADSAGTVFGSVVIVAVAVAVAVAVGAGVVADAAGRVKLRCTERGNWRYECRQMSR
eukprot:scaffold39883_cov44-Attheya_sp.AAC.1